MTCSISVLASPTTTTVKVVSGNSPTDDVIAGESLAETEPCSRQRMVVCYSAVDARLNANSGALVPNLTHPALDRLCRYADRSNNNKKLTRRWDTRTWDILPLTPPDGGVPLRRSPWNFARRSKDGCGTKWRRNAAESFNPWVGRTNVTDDRRSCDSKDHSHNIVTFGY